MSDTRTHDQPFVQLSVDEMLAHTDIPEKSIIVIESDNCTSQYKSAQNFTDMQQISNKYNTTVIRLFGIAGHGKGEVDHVGGITKVAARQEITKGAVFSNSSEITTFLQDKFRDKEFPKYHITIITSEDIVF